MLCRAFVAGLAVGCPGNVVIERGGQPGIRGVTGRALPIVMLCRAFVAGLAIGRPGNICLVEGYLLPLVDRVAGNTIPGIVFRGTILFMAGGTFGG